MKAIIYCRRNDRGKHDFFLRTKVEDIYLFTQDYRKGVHAYFSKGVYLEHACDHTRSRHDTAIMKTMEKIPSFIRYVEKEYGIEVLEKTKKKAMARNMHRMRIAACA